MILLGFDVKEWVALATLLSLALAGARYGVIRPLLKFGHRALDDHIGPLADRMAEKMDRLGASIDLLEKTSREQHAEIHERIERNERHIEKVETKVDTQNDKLNRLEGRLDSGKS